MSNIFTADLKPGDFVRCMTGYGKNRLYLIEYVDGNHLHLSSATKAGKPDMRFIGGWSGYFNDIEWQVIRRSEP